MFRGKKLLFALTIILAVAMGFALVACSGTNVGDDSGVAGISVAERHTGPYVLGEDVDLSEITIIVTYNNGEVKIVPVSDYMLSLEDRELFFTKGTYTVYINYEGATTALQIAVVGADEIANYTAEFKSNGGSLVDSQRGTVIKTFYAPQRPGYTFDGWYTNYDLTGDKVKAPYTLNQNTIFYAKWVDNRRCTITFFDFYGDMVREFEIVYGTSININDYNTYPAPEEIEGMVFSGWSTSGGNTEEITADLSINAIYVSKDCIVQIYTDVDESSTPRVFQKKYGDPFDVNSFVLPTKDGHVSRWVVYKNDELSFEELPSSGVLTVKEEKIVIKAYHVINTYSINIENGKASQIYSNLKSGNIETEPVYRDAEKHQSYTVNYDSNFNISSFTETPYLVNPETIYGYDAVWCLVVQTLTGEIWYNSYNQIWNDVTQQFEAAEGGVKTIYDLCDTDGNYLASINGKIENGLSVLVSVDNIKANITIKPKYIKKNYRVTLRRNKNNAWTEITSFSVPYLSDFKLYDPNMADYEGLSFNNAEDVERSYLFKNVASWINEVDWNDVYWRSDSGLVDDWTIEWFSQPDMSPNAKIDFTETNGALGSVEISGDYTLYCKDTDQRRYDVYVYYDYDFTVDPEAPLSEIYKKRVIYNNLKENDPITLPTGYSSPIIRTYTHDNKNYNISYIFKGWYDFPYNDPSGYTGSLQNPETARNKNVYFYAHYECTTTYNLLVYDKTQKTAYDGRVGYENLGYDVQEESIFYQLSAGSVFDSKTMLYKGRTETGSNTSGQVFYEKYSFIEWFDNELTTEYNSLLSLYGEGDKSASIVALNGLISALNQEITTCEEIWSALYSYDYGSLDKASYESGVLTAYQYNQKQKQKKIYQDQLELIETYSDNQSTRDSYAADMSAYKLYTDSVKTLNYAYDYTDFDIENDNVKYKFLGWYLDENYANLYQNEIDFEWFVTGENLTLYAKWADQEKGTEGLVFQKMVIDGEIVLAVVDLINAATYNTSIYYGCGYNDLENKYYSLNLNDQGNMPINLGTNLDIQIPKEHGGDNTGGYRVIGILAEAFKKFSSSIKSIAMPGTLMFIEERAFYNCNLENFYISSSLYIDADDSRALYQTQSYVVAPEDIDTVGNLQTTGINAQANTLLAYANKSAKDYLTLLSGTTRIAANAFSGASKLKYIDLGDSLVSIGDYALEATALIGHYDTGNTIGTDTLIFPSTLQTIGTYAFKDTVYIRYIQFSGVSSLNNVGLNAFKSTYWYNAHVGPIIINNNLIGIRNGNEIHFEKDINGQIIYYGENLDQARIISGNNYMYYVLNNNRYTLCKVEINDPIHSISSGAFLDYSSIIDVYFFDCSVLTNIYGKAFENCTNIENIYLYGATSSLQLGLAVFKNCPILNVYVPDKDNLHASFDNYASSINLINIV